MNMFQLTSLPVLSDVAVLHVLVQS